MKPFNKFGLLIAISIFIFSCGIKKPINIINSNYFEQTPPGLTPKVFAPNIISFKDRAEFGSIFSKDGTSFFYGDDTKGNAEIRFAEFRNNKWSEPVPIITHEKYSYADPCLSPDEMELYFISDMPRNEKDTILDYDIWYVQKEGSGWSKPINAGNLVNSDKNEYYISFTNKGKMYFASNKNASEKRAHDFDIYTTIKSNNKFTKPQRISEVINSGRYEAEVFVAPDESYLIFSSARKGGYGKADLHISFKDENNNWQTPINLGATINTKLSEICPFVTHDGKYLFYSSHQDIYWVSTKIFDALR